MNAATHRLAIHRSDGIITRPCMRPWGILLWIVRMTRRGIHYNKVVVAMARELVGYLWATLYPREAEAPPSA